MGWHREKSFYGKKKNFRYHRNGRQFIVNPQNLANEGRKFEDRVEQIIHTMFQCGEITSFEHHPANSLEDRDGKDFTVAKTVDGESLNKSFGVSISMKRAAQSRIIHPDTPQFHFSLWSKENEVRETILGLFQS